MPSRILLANAPCSWGTLEFEGLEGEQVGYAQMLDELAATGYVGTELGDWGYMPTDPVRLKEELSLRRLSLRGAFVPVALRDQTAHSEGIRRAVRTAHLLASAGDLDDPPVLVLADGNGVEPERVKHAGRIEAHMGLNSLEWDTFARGAMQVAQAVRDEAGLRTVFHHHCAGFVETPDEIARFLELTDPELIGLVFDTGHYIYGSGTNDASVLGGLEAYADRIWYMHFKDCHADVAARARGKELDYFEAVGQGLFCELGQGCIDFAAVLSRLKDFSYSGWIVVEQDVLPGMGTPKESALRNRTYLQSLGL